MWACYRRNCINKAIEYGNIQSWWILRLYVACILCCKFFVHKWCSVYHYIWEISPPSERRRISRNRQGLRRSTDYCAYLTNKLIVSVRLLAVVAVAIMLATGCLRLITAEVASTSAATKSLLLRVGVSASAVSRGQLLLHSSMFRQVRQASSSSASTTRSQSKMAAHYKIEERGALHTLDYRVYFSEIFTLFTRRVGRSSGERLVSVFVK